MLKKVFGTGGLDSFMALRDLGTYIAKYVVKIHGTVADKVPIIIFNFVSRETKASSTREKS